MHFDLKFGGGRLPLDVDDSKIIGVIMPNPRPPLENAIDEVRACLAAPEGTPPLESMLKERAPKKLVIVVNDITRPTPYPILMPPLMEAIEKAGIPDEHVTLITATGIHDPHTPEKNLLVYGEEICARYTIIQHNAFDPAGLVYKGKLPSGYDFWLNKIVDEADFLITLGVVMPHYFAGFSGGRKSILPGVAGKETVEKDHARMVELMDNLPPIRGNPVSLEMIDAARRVGVDFILNVVVDDNENVVKVFAGDLEKAWYKAVDVSEAMYMIPIAKQADIVISAASGFPRDINLYQSQKALDHADRATKKGGTIILVAECRDGYGEKVFEDFMNRGWTPQQIMEEIKTHFVMGGHKAYGFAKVAAEKNIIMVTSLSEKIVASCFAKKAATLQEALAMARAQQGADASIIIMPEGSVTAPVVS